MSLNSKPKRASRLPAPTATQVNGKSIFYCIVDASAFCYDLVLLQEWLADGIINVLVPEITVAHLRTVKAGNNTFSSRAEAALRLIEDTKGVTTSDGHTLLEVPPVENTYSDWADADAAGSLKSTLRFDERYKRLVDRLKMASEYKPKPRLSKKPSADGSQLTAKTDQLNSEPQIETNGGPVRPVQKPVDAAIEAAIRSVDVRSNFNKKFIDVSITTNYNLSPSADSFLRAAVWHIHQDSGDFGDESKYVVITVDSQTRKMAEKFQLRVVRPDALQKRIEAPETYSSPKEETLSSEEELMSDQTYDLSTSDTTVANGTVGGDSLLGIVTAAKDDAGPALNGNKPMDSSMSVNCDANGATEQKPVQKDDIETQTSQRATEVTELTAGEAPAAETADVPDEDQEEIVFKPRPKRSSASNTPVSGRSNRNSVVENNTEMTATLAETNVNESENGVFPMAMTRNARAPARSEEAGNAPSPRPNRRSPRPQPRSPIQPSPTPRASREIWRGSRGGRRSNGRDASHGGQRPDSRPTSSAGRRTGIPTGPIDPDSFGRAPPVVDHQDVEYTLRSGTTRADARGRGKLWTP